MLFSSASFRPSPVRTCAALLLLGASGSGNSAEPPSLVALDTKGKKVAPRSGPLPHACVLDTRTGLTWEVKTDDKGLRDKDWIYSWFTSMQAETGNPVGYPNSGRCHNKQDCDTERYAGSINKAGLCGFRDWRLPTSEELEGLLRNDREGAKIDPLYFPNTPAAYFWSSDYVPLEVGGAMLVSFELGMSLAGNSASGAYVRLVRGPAKRP
jgi:hypothetical protein